MTVNQSKQAHCSHDLRDTSQTGGRTFQFIDEVQNCLDLLDVSSAGTNDTKNREKKLLDGRVVCYMGQISADIRFRPIPYNLSALSVSSLAINIQQDQDARGNSS